LDLQETLREIQEAHLFFQALVLLVVVVEVIETFLHPQAQVVLVVADLSQIPEQQHILVALEIPQAKHRHKAILAGPGVQLRAFIWVQAAAAVQI
jgi:hypothetical protein